MKIIGNTVGMGLPKPNLTQTNPKKGDYVKGKDEFVSEFISAINTTLEQAKESGEFDGKDGTSVTVKSVSESTEDGGSNVVTFSDGTTLTVKNGSSGSASENVSYQYAVENILCIGDSLTEGACVINGFTGAITQNYPYYLGRMLNCKTTNAGKSGETISGWYANNIVTSKYDFSQYDSAVIWLGTNSPCTGMPTNAEISAFVPENKPDATTANHALYLCKIIETIQTANPDCFILLCGIFSPSAKAGTHNAVVLQIANKYGVYFVDMTDLHNNIMPELHGNLLDPHFGKAGNIFIASRLINYIRNKIADNPIRAEFGYGDGFSNNVTPDNEIPSGNLVPYAIDTDGSLFNGTGYKNGYRLSGNLGEESVQEGMVCTGFIPFNSSAVLRMAGTEWSSSPATSYLYFYDADFNYLGGYNSNGYCIFYNDEICLTDKSNQSVSVENTITTFNLQFASGSPVQYVRVSAVGNGADMIVTVNDEIVVEEETPKGNLVPYAIDTDGSLFNGAGYIDGKRFSTSTAGTTLSNTSGMTTTGFIPVSSSDVIRMAGTTWGTSPANSSIAFYDKNFAPIGLYTGNGYVTYTTEYNGMTNAQVLTDKSQQSVSVVNGVTTFNLTFNTADKSGTNSQIAASHIAYMRISAIGNGADMIVTLNEEIN